MRARRDGTKGTRWPVMVFNVAVGGVIYAVDERDDRSITIDGRPLTRLSSDPRVKSQYALETEILAKDSQARIQAQAAFSGMIRRQMM